MKIQELVCNRPSLISQVGSVSTFGCMLQFRIFFLFSNLCVYSVQCRQKSKTEQCQWQCVFKYRSSARKRERECYNYVCVQFSVGLCQHIHIYVHIVCSCMYMCSPRGAYLCHCQYVQAGGWVGVNCVLMCRRPWMLSRLQPGTAMVHVQCRKQQEQATKLSGHTLKTSTFTLASSSMSSRAMKQAIDTSIVLACQSEQEVQGIFMFI